jgi:hypothetical protein
MEKLSNTWIYFNCHCGVNLVITCIYIGGAYLFDTINTIKEWLMKGAKEEEHVPGFNDGRGNRASDLQVVALSGNWGKGCEV